MLAIASVARSASNKCPRSSRSTFTLLLSRGISTDLTISTPALIFGPYSCIAPRSSSYGSGQLNSRRFLSASAHSSNHNPSSNDTSNSFNASNAPNAPNISPLNTTLALSVHFKHPDLGMNKYEILSRATAFLINVDPPSEDNEWKEREVLRQFHEREGRNDERNDEGDKDASDNSSKGLTIGNSVTKPLKLKSNTSKGKSPTKYPHLLQNQSLRRQLLQSQHYAHTPASGPPRLPHQLNWLEFCPPTFRPMVHVVVSSHVVSPWLWENYYDQDWLKVVNSEHCKYSLEVWRNDKGQKEGDKALMQHDGKLSGKFKPVAEFELNPYPIHHPMNLDVAVLHLKNEDIVLKDLTDLGVQPLDLPTLHQLTLSERPVFNPGDRVLFQGFEVFEANTTDQQSPTKESKEVEEDDVRKFHPYSSEGTLAMASPDRFLAKTNGGPLPEGLCGGPAIQVPEEKLDVNKSLTLRGVVEGIVPTNHDDSNLAGLASFIPDYRIREFIDFAERIMLEQILPEGLFKQVVDMKEQKEKKGTVYEPHEHGQHLDENQKRNRQRTKTKDEDGINDPDLLATMEATATPDGEDTPNLDAQYQEVVAKLHEKYTPQEVDAMMATVERERKEVIDIMEKEGGNVDDLDEVIARVRRKTYEERDRLLKEIQEKLEKGEN